MGKKINKKEYTYRDCDINIQETVGYTDLTIKLPDGEEYNKRFLDKRPDKVVRMIDNQAFEWQIMEWVNVKLAEPKVIN